MAKGEKGKYWTCVCWLDSMVDNWQDEIADLLQIPYCYCIHDKDKTSRDDEDRKTHVHIIIAFSNTTTYNHALKVFKKLMPSCAKIEQVLNIRYMYDYLIHDTESCRKKNKHLYDRSERIEGNNFDIGGFEQISISDKRAMCKNLCDFIINHNIDNFSDFYKIVFDYFDSSYLEVIISYSGLFERLCKGNYLNSTRRL